MKSKITGLTVLYHASPTRGLTLIEPRANSVRDPHEGPVVFATPDKAIASMFLVRVPQHSGKFDAVPYYVAVKSEFLAADRGGSLYEVDPEVFAFDGHKGLGELEWTTQDSVVPQRETEYPSALELMLDRGVQVYLVDASTFRNIGTATDHGLSILQNLTSENQLRNRNVTRLT